MRELILRAASVVKVAVELRGAQTQRLSDSATRKSRIVRILVGDPMAIATLVHVRDGITERLSLTRKINPLDIHRVARDFTVRIPLNVIPQVYELPKAIGPVVEQDARLDLALPRCGIACVDGIRERLNQDGPRGELPPCRRLVSDLDRKSVV